MTSEDFTIWGWKALDQRLVNCSEKLETENVITEEDTVPTCWSHTVMATTGLNSELKEMNPGEWTLKQRSWMAGTWGRRSVSALNQHTHTSASLLLWHTSCSHYPLWANPSLELLASSGQQSKVYRKSDLLLYHLWMEKSHADNDVILGCCPLPWWCETLDHLMQTRQSSELPGSLVKYFFLQLYPLILI